MPRRVIQTPAPSPDTADPLDGIVLRLRPVFAAHGVLRAIVFGSLARGDATRRSDLDLIVVQDTDKRFLERYEGLLHDVAEAVPGRDVEMLVYTPTELERLRSRRFVATALHEGKVIYESCQEQG